MKIYTKTGDSGTTSLYSGERISKSNIRIEVYGIIDEMLATITLAMEFTPHHILLEDLNRIRETCFILSVDFASTINITKNIQRIKEEDVISLENLIDKYNEELPPLKQFIMPGGSKVAAFINLARTICRRAERKSVLLASTETINDNALLYLNRLSDYLFVAMRYSLYLEGKE